MKDAAETRKKKLGEQTEYRETDKLSAGGMADY